MKGNYTRLAVTQEGEESPSYDFVRRYRNIGTRGMYFRFVDRKNKVKNYLKGGDRVGEENNSNWRKERKMFKSS